MQSNSYMASFQTTRPNIKPDQGVDKLPPSSGAWHEHIQWAHVQARVWFQDLKLTPRYPWPSIPWMAKARSQAQVPVLSKEAPVPDAVLQLVRCNCESTNVESRNKCALRCSCKTSNLVCTELCARDEDKCQNSQQLVEDDADNE